MTDDKIFNILKKRLKMLYKARNNSGNDLEIVESSIWVLEYILKGQHVKYVDQGLNIEAKLNFETKELQYIRKYQKLLNSLCESKMLPFKDFNLNSLRDINTEELFEFTYDFFKEYFDEYIFQYFAIMFNNRNNLVYVSEDRDVSYSFFLPYSMEHFIFFRRIGTIEDFPELVHEYGHGIANFVNYNIKSQYSAKFVFLEIVSTFFELIANYHLKMHPEYCSYQEHMDTVIFNNYVMKSILIKEDFKIADLWKDIKSRNCPDPIETLVREYNILSESSNIEDSELVDIDMDLETLLDNNLIKKFPYILGYIISIELFNIYINDKERCLYILKQLMSIDWNLPNKQYFKEIIKLGLEPNAHLEEYKQYILHPSGVQK